MDTSDVRRRLLETLDRSRRDAAAHRTRVQEAEAAWTRLLPGIVVPIIRQITAALRAEGYPFTVSTPAGRVRMASDRSPQDFIEIALDTDADPPAVIGLVNRQRGRRILTEERPLPLQAGFDELGEDDILTFVLTALVPFVQR